MTDENQELTTIPNAISDSQELSVVGMKAHVDVCKQLVKAVMVKDMHYGEIPGTNKPTLFQPGAHKLALAFQLAPRYNIQMVDHGGNHREYEVVCELTSRITGAFVGEGVGTCSTTETKYKFRNTNTNKKVPSEYWETRDPMILGGSHYSAKKVDQTWVIIERIEHDNPCDYWNTVKKMAKKRAFNDAVLQATAASDLFGQDDEDAHTDSEPAGQTTKSKPANKNKNKNGKDTRPATQAQVKMIRAKCANRSEGEIPIGDLLGVFEMESTDEIQRWHMDHMLKWIEDPAIAPQV